MKRLLWTVWLALLALAMPAFAQSATYEAPGPFRAEVHDVRWRDAGRDRELPLRIRIPDAPGLRGVVLFSHGLGGSIDGGRFWGEQWASHGFVVIHLQHPGSDESVWRDALNPGRAMRDAASVDQFIDRVIDVKFVLDELARRKLAADPVTTKMDLSRIGMSGHSFGAITTQAIAGEDFGAGARAQVLADARPRAFIAFSPSARSAGAAKKFATIERPFFSVTGTRDGAVGLGLGVPAGQRLLPFEGMPAGDKYLLNLNDADHMIFNGAGRFRNSAADMARDEAQVRVTKATTTAFWLAYLAGDADAAQWLAAAQSYVGRSGEFRAK
jgi:predicted dienelactone hydrolase